MLHNTVIILDFNFLVNSVPIVHGSKLCFGEIDMAYIWQKLACHIMMLLMNK